MAGGGWKTEEKREKGGEREEKREKKEGKWGKVREGGKRVRK